MAKSGEPIKYGAGHLAAMGRMGLKELGSAFVPSGSNIAQPGGEYGVFGQPPPSLIAESMERGGEESVLASRMPAPPPPKQGREDRDLDRE